MIFSFDFVPFYTTPWSFPGGSDGKASACNAGDLGSILGSGREWLPTPVLLPGKFHGWRSLVGYSPWDRKESDTTEQLHSPGELRCEGLGRQNLARGKCAAIR